MFFMATKPQIGQDQPIAVYGNDMRFVVKMFLKTSDLPDSIACMTYEQLAKRAESAHFGCCVCLGGIMFVKATLVPYETTVTELHGEMSVEVCEEWNTVFNEGREDCTVDKLTVSIDYGSLSDEYDSMMSADEQEIIRVETAMTRVVIVRNELIEDSESAVLDSIDEQLTKDFGDGVSLSDSFSKLSGKRYPEFFRNLAKKWGDTVVEEYEEANIAFLDVLKDKSPLYPQIKKAAAKRLDYAAMGIKDRFNPNSKFGIYYEERLHALLPEKDKAFMAHNPIGYTALLVKINVEEG